MENATLAEKSASANESDPARGTPPARAERPWWRRPWLIPLVVVVAAFLIDELPPYLSLEPGQARIALDQQFPLHYSLLVAHIACGSIALITLCLQVWPWLRRRHPRVHRISGRVYVFGGALPSAVMALILMPFAASGFVGVTAHAVFWLGTTIAGFRAARGRRFADHRRWMLYSFALALGILWGRATVLAWPLLPAGLDISILFEMARWSGWMINVLIVHWWLNRTANRPLKPLAESRAA